MNKPTTDKAKRLASEATLIGVVCGVPFYESPTHGDESPLIYINKEGKAKLSDFWELPSYDELPCDAVY
jgi:hypothetical protein